jgi:ubiquitin carboxyl-terminal hydrolase 5/13
MGFPLPACKRAATITSGQGIEAATQWIMEHMDDPDFNVDPVVPTTTGTFCAFKHSKCGFYDVQFFLLGPFVPNEDGITMLQSMGFTRLQCIKALRSTDNNVERAADWIFSHPDEINSIDDAPDAVTAPSVDVAATITDGAPGI